MAIVVEDGTNVPLATSYVTVQKLADYAALRAITIPAGNPEREVMLIKAMDYLRTYEGRYRGRRTWTDQTLPWPRTIGYATDLGVPAELKEAQIILAIASLTMDLLPQQAASTKFATRKTVGPLTVEYEGSRGPSASAPYLPQVDSLLASVFGTGAGQIRVIKG